MSDELVLSLLICLPIANFFGKWYILKQQYDLCNQTTEVPLVLQPVIQQATFNAFRRIQMQTISQWILTKSSNLIIWTIILIFRAHSKSWFIVSKFMNTLNIEENNIIVSFVWLCAESFILVLFYTLVFMLRRENLSLQTIRKIITKKLHYILIFSILTMLITIGGEYIYLWYWMAISAITLGFQVLQLKYFFRKLNPLERERLKGEIRKLSREMNFPLRDIYITEQNVASIHCVYVTLSNSIILFKSLFDKGFQDEEIVTLVAHELVHWGKCHYYTKVILEEVWLFSVIGINFKILQIPRIYTALGFRENERPVAAGLVVVKYSMVFVYTLLTGFKNCINKKFELEADIKCIGMGKADALKRALLKLHYFQVGPLIAHKLYSMWILKDPLLYERILRLDSFRQNEST